MDNVNDIQKLKYIEANEKLLIDTAGRPKAFESKKELEKACEEYLQYAKKRYAPLTMAGLAAFLGRSRDTINLYARGDYDTKEEQFSDAIKKLRVIIEQDKIEKTLLGMYNATIAIFDLKNNHGYTDKQEIDQRYVTKDGEDVSTEDLKIINDYKNKIKGESND